MSIFYCKWCKESCDPIHDCARPRLTLEQAEQRIQLLESALKQIAEEPDGHYSEDCMGNIVYYPSINTREIAKKALEQ